MVLIIKHSSSSYLSSAGHSEDPDHSDHLLIDLSSPSDAAEDQSDPCSAQYQELDYRIQRFFFNINILIFHLILM